MSPGIPEAAPADAYLRPFCVDVKPERGLVRVCPCGDVDLREVTFLDSTGMHLMVDLAMASRAEGWRFGIIEGPAEVQRAFEVTGLRGSLPFVTA